MSYFNYFFALCVTAVLFTSCETQNILSHTKITPSNSIFALEKTFQYDPNYQYRIRKDDKISISVWGQEDLSVGSVYGIYNSNEVYGKWLMVDAEGNVEVPKIGKYHIEDFTLIELKDSLRTKLSKWIVNPIVDIKVLNKEITVMGEVKNPQVIQVDKDRNTLLEVVAKCQGFEFYANLKYIKVLRQVGKDVYVANINLTPTGDYTKRNIDIRPGDIVIVPSKKYKEFDKRIGTIIPFTTSLSAAAIFLGAF